MKSGHRFAYQTKMSGAHPLSDSTAPHGTIFAEVTHISADALVQDVRDTKDGTAKPDAIVPATLNLVSNTIDIDDQHIKMSLGMNLTAEI